MDRRGGCCIARYAGGAYNISKVDRIMIKFRPIAPKPAITGSVSGGTTPKNNEVLVRKGRAKRRYARDDNNNKRCNRKRRVVSDEKKHGLNEGVVTLPLLPETPDRKDTPARGSPSDLDQTAATTPPVQNVPICLNFNSPVQKPGGGGYGALDRTVGSCLIVECVTDTFVDGEGLGSTDEERIKNLERDTCPGFISDGLNGVGWTNEAYKRMVGPQGDHQWEAQPEMVWLMTKERLPVMYPAFACRVRLQYTRRKERNSLIVPCDVWRMDGGGFAWRLDVKAALSLGR